MLQIGGGHNSHERVLNVAEMVIRESRATRIRPFNEYRKKFNLKPYSSFYEFTGKQEQYCTIVLCKSIAPRFIFIYITVKVKLIIILYLICDTFFELLAEPEKGNCCRLNKEA